MSAQDLTLAVTINLFPIVLVLVLLIVIVVVVQMMRR